MLIELLFIAENFQCGADAPLAQFEIIVEEQNTDGGSFFHTLTVGERLVIEEDKYIGSQINAISNADCMAVFEFETATPDSLPVLPGLYDQPDVASYLDVLTGAEEIYLYEFGSKENGDYQDVVLRIDWDYTEEQEVILYAD